MIGDPVRLAVTPNIALMGIRVVRPTRRKRQPARTIQIGPHLIDFRRRYAEHRGKYRIFNAAVYRLYYSASAAPTTDDLFTTNSTLPHTPADTYGNGSHYFALSYFNGVLDSGFLPIGANGETYLRLDVATDVEVNRPPQGPLDWRLEERAGGVVRVVGVYYQAGALRATQWAIAYTTDESAPPEDTPDETVTMGSGGAVVVSYDLPAQEDATVVNVRLQTRRQDSETWYYSEGSTAKTVTVDTDGPTAPGSGGAV